MPHRAVQLLARWRSAALDRQLAAGIDPRSSAVLAARARSLTARRSRERMADGLARALHDAQDTRATFGTVVRPNTCELLEARPVLGALDRHLRSHEPIRPRGAAILHELLTDPTGPMYQPAEPDTLGSHLRAAAATLVTPAY